MRSSSDGNLSYLCLGDTSLLVSRDTQIQKMKRYFQVPTKGLYSYISLSTCHYWYATLNSCKYLKSETHLRNVQVNKDSSVDKGIVKICPVASMVRKNWSWIVVASCGLHYSVSPCFGSFWVFVNFSTAEKLKYLFLTAMRIHIMARTVKKQTNFIFSSLVT